VIKKKISGRFEGVSSRAQEIRWRILRQATEDLHQLHETKYVLDPLHMHPPRKCSCFVRLTRRSPHINSIETFNSLVALESQYSGYMRRSQAALADAHRVSKKGVLTARRLVQEHDRRVQAHGLRAPVVPALPESLQRWL